MKPLVRSASDPKQVKSAGKQERWEEKQMFRELAELMEDPRFQRYIYRYLKFCEVYECHLLNNSSIYTTQGVRYVGNRMMEEMKIANYAGYLKVLEQEKKEYEEEFNQ